MSNPTPTGQEWTPESVKALVGYDIGGSGTIARAHNAALAAAKPTASAEWTGKMLADRRAIQSDNFTAEEINAALAAAFKRGKLEGVFASPDEGEVGYVSGLEKQLAAEREKLGVMRETYMSARRSSDMGWARAEQLRKELDEAREVIKLASLFVSDGYTTGAPSRTRLRLAIDAFLAKTGGNS